MDDEEQLADALAKLDGRLCALELMLATLWRRAAPADTLQTQSAWEEIADLVGAGNGQPPSEHEQRVARHMRDALERLRRLELALIATGPEQ